MKIYTCSRWGSIGNGASARNNNQSSSSSNSAALSASGSRAGSRPRGRVVRAITNARGRGGGVIVGTRPVVPASVVPDELINQCQVVLQGKSRNLIIRELQRTVSISNVHGILVSCFSYLKTLMK